MTPEVTVDLFRDALWLTTMMVSVLVVPSLIVGLLVAMFQAATQIRCRAQPIDIEPNETSCRINLKKPQ